MIGHLMAVWFGVVSTVLTVIIIPLVTILMRGTVRWTRVELKLDQAVDNIRELRVQEDIRDSKTDRRLRWLEENLWKNDGRPSNTRIGGK